MGKRGGDSRRGLELLWGIRVPPLRGPRGRLDVSALVEAAIAIADAQGIAAVSTRRVADALGVSAMSFYTYIPDKSVLLDLMLDAVAEDADALPDAATSQSDWRKDVRRVAEMQRAWLLRHPWVLEVTTHRPSVGPQAIRTYDRMLSAFDGLGLDEVEMDLCVTLLVDYVRGSVRNVVRAAQVARETGQSDEDWWQEVGPVLAQVDLSPWPLAARVGAVVGELYGTGDPERAFSFGLERLLDGLDVLITQKTVVPPRVQE
jgi:AcrR family transcriptional regulator